MPSHTNPGPLCIRGDELTNMVCMFWSKIMWFELERVMSYRAEKRSAHGRTDTYRHTKETTIPEGQIWRRVKNNRPKSIYLPNMSQILLAIISFNYSKCIIVLTCSGSIQYRTCRLLLHHCTWQDRNILDTTVTHLSPSVVHQTNPRR